jgi:hypothetical protein
MKAEDIIGICCILFVTGFSFTCGFLAMRHVQRTSNPWEETTNTEHLHEPDEQKVLYVDEFGELHEVYAHPL